MADTSSRRGGIFTINIGGQDYDCVDGVTYMLSRFKRETQTGISGVQGYKESPVAGQIKAKLRDSQGIKAGDFADMTSVQVIGHAANGKTVVGTGMWTVETVEVDPIEGTFEVTFEGPSVRELTNA